MASIRTSWRKSIGVEVEAKGERFPCGLQLLQKHLETAVRSRSTTTQPGTSSMPSKIPLRPSERDNAEMTAIALRNKRIGKHQFVFAGGKKRKREEIFPEDAVTIDDRENPAVFPCSTSEAKQGIPTTLVPASATTTVAKLFVPRWMRQSSGKDDDEHQANLRQQARTSLQKRFDQMVTNRPIREGKVVTRSGLRRAMHRDLRAAISKSRI